MKHIIPVAAAVACLAMSGCGTGGTTPTSGSSPTTPTATPSPLTSAISETADPAPPAGATEGDLVLYVSNQSFDDKRVHLRVALNGDVVVDDDFDVESQHNWVRFPLTTPASVPLELVAESDSGATLTRSVTAVPGFTRAVVINHWAEGDNAKLEASLRREPVAFD